ncbi:hypothetical protein D3C84_1098090 [compost metagenome]
MLFVVSCLVVDSSFAGKSVFFSSVAALAASSFLTDVSDFLNVNFTSFSPGGRQLLSLQTIKNTDALMVKASAVLRSIV